jgi:hypothetical protein
MDRNSKHATELPVEVVERTASETQEQRARRLFDEMARNIGREAVNHLKAMYPAALAAVPKAAELSLTNHIRNDINWRMRPLLMAMIAMHREWAEESAGGNDE